MRKFEKEKKISQKDIINLSSIFTAKETLDERKTHSE